MSMRIVHFREKYLLLWLGARSNRTRSKRDPVYIVILGTNGQNGLLEQNKNNNNKQIVDYWP